MSIKRLALIAGEPSGDVLGSTLLRGLQQQQQAVGQHMDVQGVGGPLMQAEGMHSWLDQSLFAVNGFTDVVTRLPYLLGHLRTLTNRVISYEPDMLVTIDSPALSFRVAKRMRQAGKHIPIVHIVAPTVWAWKPERAEKVASFLDGLLTLFPFEPPYFQAHNLATTFVGHPLATRWENMDKTKARETLDWGAGETIMLVLPGSRSNEIQRLAPVFGKTLARVLSGNGVDRVVIPTLPHLETHIRQTIRDWPVNVDVITDTETRFFSFAAADVALAASGTVAMELAAAQVPVVVGYSMGRLSNWYIAPKLVTPYVSVINYMADSMVQPEHIGRYCSADNLAPALDRLLRDPAAARHQITKQNEQIQKLRAPGNDPEMAMAKALMLYAPSS